MTSRYMLEASPLVPEYKADDCVGPAFAFSKSMKKRCAATL